jgi:hypothetical protein
MPVCLVVATLVTFFAFHPALAFEPILLKESAGANANIGAPCPLAGNTDGTAANYRWFNLCAGYIWIYTMGLPGEGAGVLFGGDEQPEVRGGNDVKRAITYWRNTVAGYGRTVDIFVNADDEGDGCPDTELASDLNLDAGLRWNCSEFNVDIPCETNYLIVRAQSDGRGGLPTFATDGPFAGECDANPVQRSYYYGINASTCLAWPGKTDAADNFLYWLIVDAGEPCVPNATDSRSWGAIKGLFR